MSHCYYVAGHKRGNSYMLVKVKVVNLPQGNRTFIQQCFSEMPDDLTTQNKLVQKCSRSVV